MKIDFKKEFSKKTFTNFRRRRYRSIKPDIVVCDLEPTEIVSLCNGKLSLSDIARRLGCTNLEYARFHVETLMNFVDDGSYYGTEVSTYILVATEK